MPLFKWRFLPAFMVGLLGIANAASAIDDSGIDILPNRTYIHKDSKSAVRVPLGWEVVAPYRLRKTTLSTVLGLDKPEQHMSVTVVWSPLGNRPFSDIIRAAADENLGDEYALLQTVYGKGKVGRPTTLKAGPYTVFKILIDDGPDKGNAGSVYLFEAGKGDNRWKVKIRAVYPQLNHEDHMKQVEELVNQFYMAE
jgi:hypothetical protein